MNLKKLLRKRGLTAADLPVPLQKLVFFQNEISGAECYAQGFMVLFENPKRNGFSDEPGFYDRIIPFAVANGSGSGYAFWDDGTGKPWREWPVFVLGDEGGVHIVAEDIVGLLHLLTYDCEISVDWDSAYFYKDEDDEDEPSDDIDSFREWIKGDFGLDPLESDEEADAVVAAAQARYKAAFDTWASEYIEDVHAPAD